jgi:hypothetical protein
MLPASPESATTRWVVALPAQRPLTLTRSVDGGSTWVELAEISEAWSADTFIDPTVPATSFPLYDAVTG